MAPGSFSRWVQNKSPISNVFLQSFGVIEDHQSSTTDAKRCRCNIRMKYAKPALPPITILSRDITLSVAFETFRENGFWASHLISINQCPLKPSQPSGTASSFSDLTMCTYLVHTCILCPNHPSCKSNRSGSGLIRQYWGQEDLKYEHWGCVSF